MEHARQWLRLMQLSSSSLPVGSFTWSQGLEWAVEAGWVANVDAFKRWQIQQMEQSFFCVDLPLFQPSLPGLQSERPGDGQTLDGIPCSPVGKRANCAKKNATAERPLRVSSKSWEPDCPAEWLALCRQSQLCGMAWLGVRWGIDVRELALSLGYSWIESAVMAGVKLVPFGQQAAQQLIIELSDHFAAGLEQAFLRRDDALGAATPLSAIASARHETQYSRLFRS